MIQDHSPNSSMQTDGSSIGTEPSRRLRVSQMISGTANLTPALLQAKAKSTMLMGLGTIPTSKNTFFKCRTEMRQCTTPYFLLQWGSCGGVGGIGSPNHCRSLLLRKLADDGVQLQIDVAGCLLVL